MKSERRHELQKNTLDAELMKLKGFYQKHGTKISWGLVIVAAVVLAVVLWNRRTDQKRADVQYQYEQVQRLTNQPGANREEVIAQLTELTQQSTVPWVAADAAFALGQLYAIESLTAPTEETKKQAIESARAEYARVIEQFDDFPVAVAGAQLGLGKIEEGLGNFEAARKHYQAVLDMPSLDGYPVKSLAQEALQQVNSMGSTAKLATTLPAWLEEQRKAEKEKAAAAAKEPTQAGS